MWAQEEETNRKMWENFMRRSFMKCKPHLKCIMGDQKYKDEMGGACGTCDREEKNVYGFCETAEGGRSFAIHWDR
jgi:hypothetical protein